MINMKRLFVLDNLKLENESFKGYIYLTDKNIHFIVVRKEDEFLVVKHSLKLNNEWIPLLEKNLKEIEMNDELETKMENYLDKDVYSYTWTIQNEITVSKQTLINKFSNKNLSMIDDYGLMINTLNLFRDLEYIFLRNPLDNKERIITLEDNIEDVKNNSSWKKIKSKDTIKKLEYIFNRPILLNKMFKTIMGLN